MPSSNRAPASASSSLSPGSTGLDRVRDVGARVSGASADGLERDASPEHHRDVVVAQAMKRDPWQLRRDELAERRRDPFGVDGRAVLASEDEIVLRTFPPGSLRRRDDARGVVLPALSGEPRRRQRLAPTDRVKCSNA